MVVLFCTAREQRLPEEEEEEEEEGLLPSSHLLPSLIQHIAYMETVHTFHSS